MGVSQTECKRKSLPWLHLPLKSKSSLHPKENTPSGSVDLFWPLCLPSNKCGSQNKSMTNLVLESFTENASKIVQQHKCVLYFLAYFLPDYYNATLLFSWQIWLKSYP